MIKYPGGKGKIAKKIISIFPDVYPDLRYIEVFGGAGWVLFNKEPSVIEVYNDLNYLLYITFKVVRDYPEELFRKLMLTPVGTLSFEECKEKLTHWKDYDDIEIARCVIYVFQESYSGYGKSQCRYYASDKRFHLRSFTEKMLMFSDRLKNVYFECLPYDECINKYRSEYVYGELGKRKHGHNHTEQRQALFYVDPPYIQGHSYTKSMDIPTTVTKEFTYEDHKNLAKLLKSLKYDYFVLSIDLTPEVEKLYKGGYIYSLTNITGNLQKQEELVITNYYKEDVAEGVEVLDEL